MSCGPKRLCSTNFAAGFLHGVASIKHQSTKITIETVGSALETKSTKFGVSGGTQWVQCADFRGGFWAYPCSDHTVPPGALA